MQVLTATEKQLAAVYGAIAEADLDGVEVSASFLGRVLVRCPDAASAARISRVLDPGPTQAVAA